VGPQPVGKVCSHIPTIEREKDEMEVCCIAYLNEITEQETNTTSEIQIFTIYYFCTTWIEHNLESKTANWSQRIKSNKAGQLPKKHDNYNL
jgi:hypothetical protein